MRPRVVALLAALVVMGVVTPSTAAHALAGCDQSTFRSIFVRTSLQYGVRGKISTRTNALETSCDGGVAKTAHFTDCSIPTCNTFVETGVRQFVDYGGAQEIFTEEFLGGVKKSNVDWTTVAADSWFVGRARPVKKADGSYNMHMEYDLLNGAGWHNPVTYNIGWAPGYPMGETEKQGSSTTMYSSHRNLKYYSSSGGEYNWASMVCAYDNAANYQWQPVSGSNNDYDVVLGSLNC